MAAVLDPAGAVEHFSVLDLGDDGFALEPRQTGGVARVEVKLGARSLPVEVVIIDPQGSVNRLQFSISLARMSACRSGPSGNPPASRTASSEY